MRDKPIKKSNGPWYLNYEAQRTEVLALRSQYEQRCSELSAMPSAVIDEVNRSIIAKSVHESNWQEGIELDPNRTRELAEAAIDSSDFEDRTRGPHLDVKGLLTTHRRQALALMRKGCSQDELAAFNLARAHIAIRWLALELTNRLLAGALQAISMAKGPMEEEAKKSSKPIPEQLIAGFRLVERLRTSTDPVAIPTTDKVTTEGELVGALLGLDFEEVINPMSTGYIHFLHKVLFCGVMDLRKCGAFRRIAVHVPGNPSLEFPPWQTVQGLMNEFCKAFPPSSPVSKADGILAAAKASHKFTVIHPYSDGNGRISRLLMNLVLVGRGFPIIYLKADKTGRHRYITALRRADRGNYLPLASLICRSLNEVYRKLLAAVGVPNSIRKK